MALDQEIAVVAVLTVNAARGEHIIDDDARHDCEQLVTTPADSCTRS
jgi:hypothetical protein